jgi:hypothetical protein
MATFSGTVNANGQDGNRWASSGFFNNTFYFGRNGEAIHAFIYFPSVTIPQGATITAATVTLRMSATQGTGTTVSRFRCEAADNPSPPTTAGQFDGRTRTTAYVDWTMPVGSAGNNYTSPDLSAVVQEVVNRGGWASGNMMGFLCDDQSSTQWREYNQNEAGSNKPQLDVTYTTGGGFQTAWASGSNVLIQGLT